MPSSSFDLDDTYVDYLDNGSGSYLTQHPTHMYQGNVLKFVPFDFSIIVVNSGFYYGGKEISYASIICICVCVCGNIANEDKEKKRAIIQLLFPLYHASFSSVMCLATHFSTSLSLFLVRAFSTHERARMCSFFFSS